MSNRFVNWVRDMSKATKSDHHVLLILASFADEMGECFPSITRLVKATRLSRRQVIMSLKRLVEMGELRVLKSAGCGNRYQCTCGTSATTAPVQPLHGGGATTAPLLVQPLHPEQPREQPTNSTPPIPLVNGDGESHPRRRFAPGVSAKKKKEPSPEFLEFWREYPKHEGCLRAWEAWQKKNPPLEEVLEAVKKQRKRGPLSVEKRFIPLATSWLNGERWDDDL
jgi:hypothetical protein